MARRSGAICDSLFCTLAVATPVCTAVVVYRNDLRQLLRILFIVLILFGAFVATRHTFFQLLRRVRVYLWNRRPPEKREEEEPRADLDQRRAEARRRAQEKHNQKTEDYERRIGEPRREQKLKQLEEKMKNIRGFRGEGHTLDAESSARSLRSKPQGQAPMPRSPAGGQGRESPLSNATESDDNTETVGDERTIIVALKLPEKTVRRQFLTRDKVQVLYDWMQSLGYSPEDYCIATLIPKQLLSDSHKSLEEYGLLAATTLVIEEKE